MNHFIQEAHRIKAICFSNQAQIDKAVNIKKYIDTHFDQEINLDVLAHELSTSKFHLIRIFKRYHGLTPRQYLIQKRMEQAKKMLQSGKSVSETCYQVGFESLTSFSHLFKSKTGMPPSVYRKATFDKSKS